MSDPSRFRVRPIVDAPVISPATPVPGGTRKLHNINGPSLVRVPVCLFDDAMRHAGLQLRGDELRIFWTRVGDAPERIWMSTVDLRGDWMSWRESEPVEVHRPVRDWEGAGLPIEPSVRSAISHPANQLRDPFVFEEEGSTYLVYAVAGESGIAIARLEEP